MTKDKLIVQNAQLEQTNKNWAEADTQRRLEFAKAFGWFKKRGMYDYQDEYRTPTWIEIFVEIGKLLAARTFYNFKGNLSELQCKVESLTRKIDELPSNDSTQET